MAFKGIDFAALAEKMDQERALSPEARAELEARREFGRDAVHVAADEKARDGSSRDLKVARLVEDPRSTGEMGGGMSTTFYLEGGARAVYKLSEAERIEKSRSHDPSPREREIHDLRAGDTISLLGEDKRRSWRNGQGEWRSSVEFAAARMGAGEMTREQLSARVAGGLAEASERFVEASSERAKEVIARGHLGQEPMSGPPVMSKGPTKEYEGPDGLEGGIAFRGRNAVGR